MQGIAIDCLKIAQSEFKNRDKSIGATGFEPANYCLCQSDRIQKIGYKLLEFFIRDTLGNKNWQIVKNKEKTMIGLRF